MKNRSSTPSPTPTPTPTLTLTPAPASSLSCDHDARGTQRSKSRSKSKRRNRLCWVGIGLASPLVPFLLCFPWGNRASSADPVKPVPIESAVRFPTVAPQHNHVRALLENAMRYVAPQNRIIDAASGYAVEGWNHDPKNGLYLRSFTQLTVIGLWMELLANVLAGNADTPYLSREQALTQLTRVVKSLRQDQQDPHLSAKRLLGNFLDLAPGKRQGPLASDVDKIKFLQAFGPKKGEAIWKALQSKGWIVSRNNDREAAIQRGAHYGWDFFNGPLAPYADKATKQKILQLLDQRVVMVVFGDNANLSASVAKTIGGLLSPAIKDKPEIIALRSELERFLEDQREGYAHFYDPKAGLFYFGWDATRDRLFGWEDLQGNWKTGHMDYLVNEFRGPATFIVLRYGLPTEALKNLGFTIKPYRMRDGSDVYTLAPWEGSAFQLLGLELWLGELESPSWRRLLENAVDIEIDYASRHGLPGFLSESYTGEGTLYTGNVGIPEIAVSPKPRITDVASLYSLGAAYTVAPEKIERFLAANWPTISRLLTDHGPWEGFNVSRQQMIRFQTSAHTFSLILGFLGRGSGQMKRYLNSKGLGNQLAETFKPAEKLDFLSDATRVFAWADKQSIIHSTREKTAFHVKGDRVNQVGIAFVPIAKKGTVPLSSKGPSPFSQGVSLSGGLLRLRYRSATPLDPVIIELKPIASVPEAAGLIPKELITRFDTTKNGEAEIQIPLPATPGLTAIKEVVITSGREKLERPIDLAITRFELAP
jgi:hypothetical protein